MFTYSNIMDQAFSWLYYKLIDCLNDFTQYIGNMGADLFDDENIKAILQFFLLFASALLLIGIVMAISEYAIGYETGRTNIADTLANIFKAMFADALFTTVPVKLYQFSISVESIIAKFINSANLISSTQSSASSSTGSTSNSLINSVLNFFTQIISGDPVLSIVGSIAGSGSSTGETHVPTVANLLFLIAFCIGFFKVLFGNLKRGTILLIQICVCPFYILSLAMGYSDGFTGWCKQIVGLCFTAFVQNLLLTIGLLVFQHQMVIGTGIMLGAAEVPRIAGRYGMDTSIRANISSMAYAANTTMSLIRAISR